MRFDRTQCQVLGGMGGGMLVAAVTLGGGPVLLAGVFAAPDGMAERLAFAFKIDLLIWLWLLLAVANIARPQPPH